MKELLQTTEISQINTLIRQVFEYLRRLRQENPLAARINNPKLPSVLTESIALHLLKKGYFSDFNGYDFDFGKTVADIIGTKGNMKIKIEVKATANSAFQYFGEKDITADYILWLHFGDFFSNRASHVIKIFFITHPNNIFKKPTKITLSRMKQMLGDRLIEKEFDLETL